MYVAAVLKVSLEMLFALPLGVMEVWRFQYRLQSYRAGGFFCFF